jgi:hypothetical protein
MKKLVIIPTYNEKENIRNIISAVFALQQDFHILEQIKKASSIRQIAVSVYGNNQDFCNTVSLTLNKYFSQDCQIEFFNSASSNCWCY